MIKHFTQLLVFIISINSFGQTIQPYNQFLGNIDFTMIGNTMNPFENSINTSFCYILTSSSATLTLNPEQEIIAAYLYWAGSGSLSQADLNIKLNGTEITPDRTFTETLATRSVFGAFADVTALVQATGSGNYTISDFDLNGILSPYCINRTNFGGWSIVVVYKDESLGSNLIKIYDGFEKVDSSHNNQDLTIVLNNLDIYHNQGNKIAFLAWEGDKNLNYDETLMINNHIVSNPPLNPATEVFNSTNSFTNSPNLHNMDMDLFDIQGYTSVEDEELIINLHSGRQIGNAMQADAIIINNIVLVLNSEVPDATIEIETTIGECDDRDIQVNYTVHNTIATKALDAGTPIAFFAGDTLLDMSATQNDIPIGGFESGSITLSIPITIPNNFTLIAHVDNDGTGESTIREFDEENNTFEIPIILGQTPTVNTHNPILEECDSDNNQTEPFNLTQIGNQMLGAQTGILIRYYTNEAAAIAGNNTNITTPNAYDSGNQTIYVRMEDVVGCYIIGQFELKILPATELTHEIPNLEYCSSSQIITGIPFNLRDNESAILNGNNPADFTITYHLNLDDALSGNDAIPNPTTYENTTSPETIWVRLEDDDGCIQYGSFELIAIAAGQITYEIADIENCSTDQVLTGISTDLTENETSILNGNDPTQFTITYHLDENGAINGTGAIGNPESYPNVSAPQTIWVRIVSLQGCVQFGSFQLVYHAAPVANDGYKEECSMLGPATFNLEDLDELVVADVTGLNFTYYLTQIDAENQVNPLPNPYTPPSQSAFVFVRVENEFGCFTIVQAQLETIINTTVLADTYFECDEPHEPNDGFTNFNLTTVNNQVNIQLGLTNTTITYHLTPMDAATGTNPISNPTNYTNTSNPQILYARAIDMNGNCGGVGEFKIEVQAVPEFELPIYLAFCNYDDKEYQFLPSFETYTWYDANGTEISNQSTVTFPSPGIYKLEVTSADLSCPAYREVEVIFDNQPVITDIEVNGNTIKIFANGGLPPYQYSYSNGFTWTNDFIIHNVPGGIHDLIVKSKYGCISTAKTFGVLGIANLITPNGDGKNDLWIIKGLEVYPDAHIKIFDRYGKIFVYRPLTTDFKWDGKYLGNPVPSGDYWYIITVEEGKSISGHISVRYRN